MSRQQQLRDLQAKLKEQAMNIDDAQRLARWGQLCTNPYVSVRIQILQLPRNAPASQLQELTQNAQVLEQNQFNLAAWQEFKQLGGL